MVKLLQSREEIVSVGTYQQLLSSTYSEVTEKVKLKSTIREWETVVIKPREWQGSIPAKTRQKTVFCH